MAKKSKKRARQSARRSERRAARREEDAAPSLALSPALQLLGRIRVEARHRHDLEAHRAAEQRAAEARRRARGEA